MLRTAALLFSFAFYLAPLRAQDKTLDVVHRIKTEAFDNSKVMEHLSYLTDLYGPRLTGSPEFHQAADLGDVAAERIRHRKRTRRKVGTLWQKLVAAELHTRNDHAPLFAFGRRSVGLECSNERRSVRRRSVCSNA